MKAIIGLGAGRCGTHSLAAILSLQPGVDCEHERKPPLRWEGESDPARHFSKAEGGRRKAEGKNEEQILADVGFYYLPHVPQLLELLPEARFICLQRAKAATVRSFVRVRPSGTNWFAGDGGHPAWGPAFPQYDCGYAEAAGRYWDDYYRAAAGLVGERFRIYPTATLNDPAGVADMLAFAGVPEPRIITGIWKSKS